MPDAYTIKQLEFFNCFEIETILTGVKYSRIRCLDNEKDNAKQRGYKMFSVMQTNLAIRGIVSVVQTPFTEAGHIDFEGISWLYLLRLMEKTGTTWSFWKISPKVNSVTLPLSGGKTVQSTLLTLITGEKFNIFI